MYTIKTLNAISPVGLAKLPANQFEIDNEAAAPQGILVRSADMHDAPLPDTCLDYVACLLRCCHSNNHYYTSSE